MVWGSLVDAAFSPCLCNASVEYVEMTLKAHMSLRIRYDETNIPIYQVQASSVPDLGRIG